MAEEIFKNKVQLYTCTFDLSFLAVHAEVSLSLSDSELEGSL